MHQSILKTYEVGESDVEMIGVYAAENESKAIRECRSQWREAGGESGTGISAKTMMHLSAFEVNR